MIITKAMFERTERIVGVFVVLMAFLIFWSPILVFVSSLLFIVFLFFKSNYFKSKLNADLSKQRNRQKANQLITNDRFGPNVRQIRSGRRQLPVRTRNVDNYFSNYSLDSMTANHFLRSDSFYNPMSGTSFGSLGTPQSMADSSYSPSLYRPLKESPISQLGNLPFVKLNAGSEESIHELKPKSSPVKPVTVRIAPMPHNLSKITLSRLSSNPNTPNITTTLGTTETSIQTPKPVTDPKTVVDALKKSLRRKREPKNDIEFEDNPILSTTKKQKRDSNELPNGIISPNKPTAKRQAIDGSELFHKRFKNNEILSSYSSLQSVQLSQSLKNKRKLSPDLREYSEVKTQKTVIPEEQKRKVEEQRKPNWNLKVEDEKQFQFANDLCLNFKSINEESKKSAPKKSYGLPLHLHSMEDHERDRNKARHRLSRFLNAVKEVSSPTSDSNETQISIETSPTIESNSTLSQQSTEVGLPTVPAAAIFTTSRIETSVTTTLLNTPISSVLTTTKESLSPQNISIDNTEHTISSNVIPIASPINSVPNWQQNTVPLFTAKPVAPTQSLFSVGTGSSSRRIAQNSRLRNRQKR